MNESREQRGEAHRDQCEPAGQLHRQVRAAHGLGILDGQTRDSEDDEHDDSAEPADRGGDVCGEGELAEAGVHGHGDQWPPIPPPIACMSTNATSSAAPATIPNAFTQRGCPDAPWGLPHSRRHRG